MWIIIKLRYWQVWMFLTVVCCHKNHYFGHCLSVLPNTVLCKLDLFLSSCIAGGGFLFNSTPCAFTHWSEFGVHWIVSMHLNISWRNWFILSLYAICYPQSLNTSSGCHNTAKCSGDTQPGWNPLWEGGHLPHNADSSGWGNRPLGR